MYDYYDIPNGQVTGDIAYKYANRIMCDVPFINFHSHLQSDNYYKEQKSKQKEESGDNMDFKTAKKVQSLMFDLNEQEDKLKTINKIKEEIQMIKALQGEIVLRGIGIDFNAHVRLNVGEIYEIFDFLSAYWSMKKYETIKDIEEL